MIKKLFVFPAWFYLLLIITIAASFMAHAARTDSAITDELAHIPAGYSYVRYLDYRLNPEHPPLLKALAGLPLLPMHLNFPTDKQSWTTDINGQWTAGTQFLYEEGNNANSIIRASRIAPILLTLATIIALYYFAKKSLGHYWALIPTFLFAFSPNILAHGHYVTTDIAATFGSILALWAYSAFLKNPSATRLCIAGIAFGIAQVCKFSAVLLIPTFGVMAAAWWIAQLYQQKFPLIQDKVGSALLLIVRTTAIGVIGVALVIFPLYALFTLHYPQEKQLSDTQTILASFGDGPTPQGQMCKANRCLADATIWATKHPLTRPLAQYMLGVLMVTQRAAGGNTNYFEGIVSASGSRTYFPTVYALKETLPTLAIIAIALMIAIYKKITTTRQEGIKNAFERILTYAARCPEYTISILFITIYWAYSMKSPLNIGFRHIIPTTPFFYLLAIGTWRTWVTPKQINRGSTMLDSIKIVLTTLVGSYIKALLLTVLCVWALFETMQASPYFLSYFNQLGGGTQAGYRSVTDSNYDWGQDMLRMQEFLRNHPEIEKFAIDYFGAGNAQYYFGDKAVYWSSDKGNPALRGIQYLVISANTIQSAIQPTSADFQRNPKDEYRWLTASRAKEPGFGGIPTPDYRIGTSLFVYKL